MINHRSFVAKERITKSKKSVKPN